MPSLLNRYLAATKESKRQSATIASLAALDHLQAAAPEIAANIIAELKEQRSTLKLIASENYSSLAVQLAMGNWLTDKYAEGYPHHRFYAGCEYIDLIEDRAASLARELFHCDYAYVQPHSGADANLVALYAVLIQKVQSKTLEHLAKKSVDELTDEEHERMRREFFTHKLMGLSLASGGHLTHGYRHNISSKLYQAIPIDVDPITLRLNYETIEARAVHEKPLVLMIGYSAYSRAIDFSRLREIADKVGAVLIIDMAHFAGLVAGKAFSGTANPIPYADIVTSTTHKTLRGPRGGLVLSTKAFADTLNRGCPYVLGGPLPHVMAAKAIAFQEALTPAFQTYAQKIVSNAQALADGLIEEGLTIVTGGTDNHLMVIDLRSLKITGRQGESALRAAKITVNRNMVPFDPEGPWYTSGIRVGTAATTTLGMGQKEMKVIARLIATVLKSVKRLPDEKSGGWSRAKGQVAEEITQAVSTEVQELLAAFPLYPDIAISI